MRRGGFLLDLRKLAQGKPCQVRLPGCDGGGETTVLAHYRLAGYSGVGMKPNDFFGSWACASCHDLVDGRKKYDGDRSVLRLAHAEGCLRTQEALRQMKRNNEL
jgi:hypothetical protein